MSGSEITAGTFLAGWTATTLRATVLLAGAVTMSALVRRGGARARHALWSATFLALLTLPMIVAVGPSLSVPVPSSWVSPAGAARQQAPPAALMETEHGRVQPVAYDGRGSAVQAAPDRDAGAPITMPRRSSSTGTTLGLIWLAGAVFGVGALGLGLYRACRVRRAAVPADADSDWEVMLANAARLLGIRRPVTLRFTRDVATPLTGGVLRPVVLLPEGARSWSAERRQLVLLHELVHVARADALRQVLSRLASSLYWFHPLVWWAAGKAALAREEACDEAVLAQGHRPSVYARHLLALAEPTRLPLPALSRRVRPHLEKRLMTILQPSTDRPHRWVATVTTLCVSVWAVSVAAVTPRTAIRTAIRTAGSGTAVATYAPDAGPRPAPAGPESTILSVGELAERPDLTVSGAMQSVSLQTTCWADGFHGDFSGTLSQRSDEQGRRSIERYGFTDGDRVVQTREGDLLLCMRTHGPVEFSGDMTRIESMENGSWLVLAVDDGRGVQQLEVSVGPDGVVNRWTVDGTERAFDAEAEQWRDAALEVVGARWQIGRIRGQVSSLRGEISSIRGRLSSLRGEISSIRGHVSSLRGQVSSARGRESSLRGEISSVRGHVSSLRGEISSIRGQESSMRGEISGLRGRISGLESARRATTDEETRSRLQSEIADVERSITAVQRRIQEFDADGRVREVEARIAEYDADRRIQEVQERRQTYDVDRRVREIEAEITAYDAASRIREVEERIDQLDVDGEVARIEQEIRDLDADARVREIEARLAPAVRRLEEAVRSVR